MAHGALTSASAAIAILALAGSALAGPPAMVSTGMGASDLTSDGLTAVGTVYDAGLAKYIVYQYTRGVGPYRTDAVFNDSVVRCSNDAGAMCWGAYDLENLCGFGTDRTNAHRWSWASGLVNMGRPANGNVCDYNVNSANDISGDGNFIVGGGWTASQCGPFRAWRYSVATQSYTQLPISVSGAPLFAPATATRADSCSADGNVICGYDQNYTPTFSSQVRRSAAWVWNGSAWTESVLDLYGGAVYAVNQSGTACVGTLSSTAAAQAGTTQRNVQRWTRSGTTWTRSDRGRPLDRGLQSQGGDGPLSAIYPGAISDDGNTIIGVAHYLDPGAPLSQTVKRPFICRPDINDGAPIDLQDYLLAQTGIGSTFDDTLFTYAGSLTPDGSAMLVNYLDNRHADCLFTGQSSILYLNGTTCEAPGINFSPVSWYEPNFPGSGYFILNVFATGSWPLTYQWQKETDTGSNTWVDLADDNCGTFDVNEYDYRGTQGPQLRLGALSGVWPGRYRCVVTNSCGSATSYFSRAATCYADYDCNSFVNGDDFDRFVIAFEAGDQEADVDGNTFVNGEDFDTFVIAFEAGC